MGAQISDTVLRTEREILQVRIFKLIAGHHLPVSRVQMRRSKHGQNLALSLSVLVVAATWLQVYSRTNDVTERSPGVHSFKAKSLDSVLRVNKTTNSEDKKPRD